MKEKILFSILTLSIALSGCEGNVLQNAVPGSMPPEDVTEVQTEASVENEVPHEKETTINIPVAEDEAGEEEIIPTEEEEPENSFEGYILSESDVSENGVYLKSTAEPGKVVIDFAGDINFDDRYAIMNALRSRGQGIFGCIDASLLDRTNKADIFMINNEFPYSKRGTPTPNKKFTFRAKPETVSMLLDQGADIVSLANNHAYDHGPDALLDTFDTLDSAGIPYVGAGHNIEEAEKPVYFIAGGMKISFVSATQIERLTPPDTKEATETEPGVLRTLDPEKFLNVIREAKENSDFCIAYVHWGSENVNNYDGSQAELGKAFAEAGADLIIGDHPHVLQGIEYMGDTPVFYSLGNYWFSSKRLDNCLVEAVIEDKEITSLQFIPCMQHDCRTSEMAPDSADFSRILDNMRTWSADNVEIDDMGFVSKK